MPTQRDIRIMALQALYELDATLGDDGALDLIDSEVPFTDEQRDLAMTWARDAYASRETPDALATELAPAWPTTRQPAVDRALIRLAWHEMVHHRTPPAVAINEAVEIAKAFSTERSPAFLNGVLDKMRKQLPDTPPQIPNAKAPTTGDAWLDDAINTDTDPKPDEQA